MLPQSLCRWILSLMLFALLFCGDAGCSQSPCSGELSKTTLDPNASVCKQRCECNNSRYEGYCIDGQCNSIKREPCDVKGRVEQCTLQPRFSAGQPVCKKRQRVCQPKELGELYWGDCLCQDDCASCKQDGQPQEEARSEKQAETQKETPATEQPLQDAGTESQPERPQAREVPSVHENPPVRETPPVKETPKNEAPPTDRFGPSCKQEPFDPVCPTDKPLCSKGRCQAWFQLHHSQKKTFSLTDATNGVIKTTFTNIAQPTTNQLAFVKIELFGDLYSNQRSVYVSFEGKPANYFDTIYGGTDNSCNKQRASDKSGTYAISNDTLRDGSLQLTMTVPKDAGGCATLKIEVTLQIVSTALPDYTHCSAIKSKWLIPCQTGANCLKSKTPTGQMERCFRGCVQDTDCGDGFLCLGARGGNITSNRSTNGCFLKCQKDDECARLDPLLRCISAKGVCLDL